MKATGERADCRRWREEGGERVAAVDKIEGQRKPEDFIGHRNRGLYEKQINEEIRKYESNRNS